MTELAQFPHCDQRVLHKPGECEFCDGRPEWQALREAWGIAFTGHKPGECPDPCDPDCKAPCHQLHLVAFMREHQPEHCPGQWIRMPCPADADRPPGSTADHRRWGGNKPTSATGDPSWPRESTASVFMYGDKGGRQDWPLRERIIRALRRPLEDRRKRRDGWKQFAGRWWYK